MLINEHFLVFSTECYWVIVVFKKPYLNLGYGEKLDNFDKF